MKITTKNTSTVRLHGLKPGDTRKIDVDRKGIPLDLSWRRRLRDSKIDGAITTVNDEQPILSIDDDKED